MSMAGELRQIAWAAFYPTLRRPPLIPSPTEARSMGKKYSSLPIVSVSQSSRRDVLIRTLLASIPCYPGLTAAAPFIMTEEPDLPGFVDTGVGVRIQEVVEGEGTAATEGDAVEFNYVCRRSNGYFVYSTVDQFTGESRPITLPLDGRKIITGLQRVLVGMRPGGKRRAVIPPQIGYITRDLEPQPREFGPQRSLLSHAGEPLLFEVQLLKIK